MNILNVILIFVVAYLVVFGEAALPGVRVLLGAQADLLPALMVYAGLNASLPVVASLAVFSGLWFDSLSANTLGVTILPLFIIGLFLFAKRDLILGEQPFAQMVLGAIASATVPAMVVLLQLTLGRLPLLGWASLWQWLVMTAGGAVATPVIFELFAWLNRVFGYQARKESNFRSDREILRGRH